MIFAILLLVIGSTWMVSLVAWHILFGLGLLLFAVGMAVGVPAGFWFHVVLRRMMRQRSIEQRDWWLRPFNSYNRLDARDRLPMRLWLYLGGAGFLLTVLGCVLLAVGAIKNQISPSG